MPIAKKICVTIKILKICFNGNKRLLRKIHFCSDLLKSKHVRPIKQYLGKVLSSNIWAKKCPSIHVANQRLYESDSVISNKFWLLIGSLSFSLEEEDVFEFK